MTSPLPFCLLISLNHPYSILNITTSKVSFDPVFWLKLVNPILFLSVNLIAVPSLVSSFQEADTMSFTETRDRDID